MLKRQELVDLLVSWSLTWVLVLYLARLLAGSTPSVILSDNNLEMSLLSCASLTQSVSMTVDLYWLYLLQFTCRNLLCWVKTSEPFKEILTQTEPRFSSTQIKVTSFGQSENGVVGV